MASFVTGEVDLITLPVFVLARRIWRVGASARRMPRGSARSKTSELGIEDIVSPESLPMDRRHNAKIDYPALRIWLEKAGSC